MTTLSTHVLDTVAGRPATGMRVRLLDGAACLFDGATDADGRCPRVTLTAGRYRLEFGVAAYFGTADPAFLDVVAVEFGVGGDGHHHVPLLVSPHAYSTYRGS